MENQDTGRAWVEIDRSALCHNARTLAEQLPPGCEVMAVVKANAYGHGASIVASCLHRMGINAFAVATVDEGIALRRDGLRGEILILGYTPPARAAELGAFDLTQTLLSGEYALALEHQGVPVNAHMAIDTGMHRLGYSVQDLTGIRRGFGLANVRVNGIYTHLCAADSLTPEDVDFTNQQIGAFYALLEALARVGIRPGKIHIQSSYGLWNYPHLRCGYVRAGLALYGVHSAPGERTVTQPDLRPVLSLRARVALVRKISKGESVGYGRCFRAERDTTIAVIAIGYGDGVPRALSCGKGSVLVCGQKAPLVGRICMDQLTVDVTGIPGVCPGTSVTLIGRDGALSITAEEAAAQADTIANELLSHLGSRLPTRMTGAGA